MWLSGGLHRDKIGLEEVRDGLITKGLIGQGEALKFYSKCNRELRRALENELI